MAKLILDKLQSGKLVIDWRKKQQARASVKLEIEKTLDIALPQSYSVEEYSQKSEIIFQHFYDNYFGEGKSIFNQQNKTTIVAA